MYAVPYLGRCEHLNRKAKAIKMTGGGDGAKPGVSWQLQVLSFSAFAVGNISLNYFNSWAVGETAVPGHCRGGFSFPFFYTMFHSAASTIAALLLMLTCNKPKDGSLPSAAQFWEYKFQFVPISLLTVVNNGFNNLSLQMVPLFVNQVIKATAPAPTAIFEFLLSGKKYNLQIYGAILLIVTGSILSNWSSIAGTPTRHDPLPEYCDMSHKAGGSSDRPASLGVIVCLISLAAASLKPVMQKILMSGRDDGKEIKVTQLAPAQIMFWDYGIGFWIYLIVWLASPVERGPSIEYLSGRTDPRNPNSGWLALGIITFGSFCAFSFNIATYYYILYTSALTSTIGSNGIKVFLIVVTALQQRISHPIAIFGIGLVVLSIGLYAYLSHLFKQEQSKKAEEAKEALAKADESTPLSKA